MNNLQLLFYKTDHYKENQSGPNALYDIKVEYKPHIASEKDFEICINQAQLDSNSILRSVISFEDTFSRNHYLVY